MLKQLRFRKLAMGLKTAVIAVGLMGALNAMPAYADSVHTAKDGDTFYLLAKQYGVNLDKLMKANPSIEAKNIYEGLKITIPGQSVQVFSAPEKKVDALSSLKVFSADRVVQAWGKTFNYKSTIHVKATAYSAAASENGKWGPVDYYGNPLKLGTIAVDPKIIPMGTKVLVTGHNHPDLPKNAFVATAMDQGGAIKGNRIDIFIPASPQKVSQFGFQDVKLYVLD
ncbi:3D domain-containing protein [Paenibacillus lentus]|uniref:LysM peptidoglycan-binding domain-containing protein n=1 Tax=Paenibacillus lentus TaxID=1338368 RepID=A0A3Q8SCE7_9BACL|nr:3D domain-containing protein [Paenibacillus lentus]AZK47418.1 LysM peptidoglycan-binding domain-containing protein [Paenibacillus lentus]